MPGLCRVVDSEPRPDDKGLVGTTPDKVKRSCHRTKGLLSRGVEFPGLGKPASVGRTKGQRGEGNAPDEPRWSPYTEAGVTWLLTVTIGGLPMAWYRGWSNDGDVKGATVGSLIKYLKSEFLRRRMR